MKKPHPREQQKADRIARGLKFKDMHDKKSSYHDEKYSYASIAAAEKPPISSERVRQLIKSVS